jgi:hypothetical protein
VAEGFSTNPPEALIYADKYCSQVCDPGASMVKSSFAAHWTGASPMAAERKLDARYVKGFTLYMKIQKRGRLPGWTKTPANAYI